MCYAVFQIAGALYPRKNSTLPRRRFRCCRAGDFYAVFRHGGQFAITAATELSIVNRNEADDMYKVIKRDGTLAEFNISKISAAIGKAFDALDKQTHPSVIDLLALKVTADFEPKIKNGEILFIYFYVLVVI